MRLVSLYWVILCFLFCLNHSFGQEKRALIIAIGEYDFYQTAWTPINSVNDVPLIKNALIAQGFDESNIEILLEEEATKKGMNKALDRLLENTGKGDIVFIHFSGHGQQIQDDNGDEIDGYDEALIPYDAHLVFEKGIYEGENHFRDDEFGKYLEQLRKKADSGGNILVVIDACHSGSATRGLGSARGTARSFEEPGYTPPQPEENSRPREYFGLYVESEDLAPMACFYGSASHELNYEYRKEDGITVGSLSYAFSKAFAEASQGTTYQGLFDQIRVEMSRIAPRQRAQAEGTLNQEILGGNILGTPDYAMVTNYYDTRNLTINRGQLHGLYADSKVGFYDIDLRDYKNVKPKITGMVVYSDLTTADVYLDGDVSKKEAENSWVYVLERNFGNMQVHVKKDIQNKNLDKALSLRLNEMDMIKLSNENYDLIVEENNQFTRGNNVMISSVNDNELWFKPVSNGLAEVIADEITERIISFSQTRFLRSIEVQDRNLTTSIEIVPIETERLGRRIIEKGELPIEKKMDASGNLMFQEGDFIKLRVTNQGIVPVYFSVIDIQPDDKVSILLPYEGRSAAEFRLEPGRTYESPIFQLFPPYGQDVMKLIASEAPMELRAIVSTRGANVTETDSATNPFQKFFANSFKAGPTTRAATTANLPGGSVHVSTVLFHIQPQED